jgi:hypothetical protein
MLRTLPRSNKVLDESLLAPAAQTQSFRVAYLSSQHAACAIWKLDRVQRQGRVLDTFLLSWATDIMLMAVRALLIGANLNGTSLLVALCHALKLEILYTECRISRRTLTIKDFLRAGVVIDRACHVRIPAHDHFELSRRALQHIAVASHVFATSSIRLNWGRADQCMTQSCCN